MSDTISIDELSRMAGERWAQEDAPKAVEPDPFKERRTEPARAREHGVAVPGGFRRSVSR